MMASILPIDTFTPHKFKFRSWHDVSLHDEKRFYTVDTQEYKFKLRDVPYVFKRRLIELLPSLSFKNLSRSSKENNKDCLSIRGIEVALIIGSACEAVPGFYPDGKMRLQLGCGDDYKYIPKKFFELFRVDVFMNDKWNVHCNYVPKNYPVLLYTTTYDDADMVQRLVHPGIQKLVLTLSDDRNFGMFTGHFMALLGHFDVAPLKNVSIHFRVISRDQLLNLFEMVQNWMLKKPFIKALELTFAIKGHGSKRYEVWCFEGKVYRFMKAKGSKFAVYTDDLSEIMEEPEADDWFF